MLGIEDAEHEETAAHAARPFITRLSCSLVGVTERISLTPGTLTQRAYGKDVVSEQYRCNYGLNPEYRDLLDDGRLVVAGVGPDREVRIVELSGHRFFVATLYVPQLSSSFDEPHPLILAYLRAAVATQATRGRGAERV